MSRENDLIVLQEQTPALGLGADADSVTLQGGTDSLLLQTQDTLMVLQAVPEAITLIETGTTTGTGSNLTVQELDGTPAVFASVLVMPNTTLVDNGDGSVTYTPALGGSGAAGRVAVWDTASQLTGDSRYTYDPANGTLAVAATASHNAITGSTQTGLAVKGRATGAGGWGVYGYGGGAGGAGVVGEVDQPDGTPLIGQAAGGQTADLLQLLVDVAVPFAVGASGRPRWVSTPPSSASDTGATGEIAWDSTHLFVCVAVDTWVRVALATW